MTGRELAHEPGSLPALKGAYGIPTHPPLVFRFLSDPERKTPYSPSLHDKFIYGVRGLPQSAKADSSLGEGALSGQSPSAVRASAKRSGADAIGDSSLGEGAYPGKARRLFIA